MDTHTELSDEGLVVIGMGAMGLAVARRMGAGRRRSATGVDACQSTANARRLHGDAPHAVSSLSIAQLVEDIGKPYIKIPTTSPQTLLHGDPHIGNTYVTPNGDVGFLDWQVV